MAAIVASLILLAATPTPAPVHLTVNDLVGMWTTIRGECSQGQHMLSANGEYIGWCFDSVSPGKWFLRGGNRIVIPSDSKKFPDEIIFIDRFEPHSDRTFLYVHYQNGAREKWMK